MAVPNPDWPNLQDAYGAATAIPELLARLSPDQSDEVWDELWGRVCHQGTIYSASPYVLPALLSAASSWAPANRTMALGLAAHIACPSGGEAGQVDLATFQTTIADLHQLALVTCVAAPDLSQADAGYLFEAALALADDSLARLELGQLAQGELQGCCPGCGQDLLFAIGQYGFFVTDQFWTPQNLPKRQEQIHPAAPSTLLGTSRWLYESACEHRHPALAEQYLHVFGAARCTCCGESLSVCDALDTRSHDKT